MKINNQKNNSGIKDSYNTYRIINNIEFEHWTSSQEKTTKKLKIEFPQYKFIKRGCEIFRSFQKIKDI